MAGLEGGADDDVTNRPLAFCRLQEAENGTLSPQKLEVADFASATRPSPFTKHPESSVDFVESHEFDDLLVDSTRSDTSPHEPIGSSQSRASGSLR